MIKLLEQAIASVQGLSECDQKLAAEFLLGFANPAAHQHQLTDDQVREVELAKQEAREGKIATAAAMDELWRQFNR